MIEANKTIALLAHDSFNDHGFTTPDGDYVRNGAQIFMYISDVDNSYREYVNKIFSNDFNTFVQSLRSWIGSNYEKEVVRYIIYGRFKKILRQKGYVIGFNSQTTKPNLFEILANSAQKSAFDFVEILNIIADVVDSLYYSGKYHDRYAKMLRLRL